MTLCSSCKKKASHIAGYVFNDGSVANIYYYTRTELTPICSDCLRRKILFEVKEER